MSERKSERDKKGRNLLARCAVICIVAAIIGSVAIPGLATLQAEDTVTVTVTVNAPEYVEETFNVTIDVDNVTDLNSGQFDLSFDSSVVNVIDVREGEINGEAVPIFNWDFVDADTVKVLVSLPMGEGVNGSGYLAEVVFEVNGKSGDKSKLDISRGLLVDTEAQKIEAEWYGDEVTVLRTVVSVDAPEYVTDTFNATIRIDNVTDLNSAQFDLSFNSSVVNVTDADVKVKDGDVDGEKVPVFNWDFVDADTVRVLVSMPMGEGVSGSGYLAEVMFEVNGKSGDKSKLDIFNGLLVDTEANEIEAEWYGDEVMVLRTVVSVDAPEYAEKKFNATIRIDNVTDLNSAQFDLSFNSSVVNVTDADVKVKDGEIDGKKVPIFNWDFVDADTVRVLVSLPMGVGVNGSGYLAEVVFEVNGKGGDKSKLDISNGLLVDTEANEIEAEWYGDEVTVLRTVVSVDAPEYVTDTFNATIRIDNVTDLNSAQFDLSFNSSVVNVTDADVKVKDGEIDGKKVPVFNWDFVDADTVRVLVSLPMGVGVSGSGYLAEVVFEVNGKSGDKSKLDISNGLLVDTEAQEIEAEWYGDEVRIGGT
uniref:Cohesin domain-containing protein n=1 Tax=Candidatus Methanophagaceae archaeon ANME-1 ERB6 TaxID=2759912 RepID=A0A7G9YZB1_9EURY|nr:hypothetical protein GMAEILFI_00017 [Methanosarcinales archaeon ANME-1 ERB6]